MLGQADDLVRRDAGLFGGDVVPYANVILREKAGARCFGDGLLDTVCQYDDRAGLPIYFVIADVERLHDVSFGAVGGSAVMVMVSFLLLAIEAVSRTSVPGHLV